ncbi:unnamed protein product [Alternaria burnsii]|nr:unnamed protein product [Alternaria burnsii]
MLTKALDPTKFRTACQNLGLTHQNNTQLAISAVTTLPISDEQDLSDNKKDIAIQTVYLQDAYEDADRIAALTSAWCTTQTGITPECKEA